MSGQNHVEALVIGRFMAGLEIITTIIAKKREYFETHFCLRYYSFWLMTIDHLVA